MTKMTTSDYIEAAEGLNLLVKENLGNEHSDGLHSITFVFLLQPQISVWREYNGF